MGLTREQKIARREFIGASDVPAIARLSRWKGPHHVYMSKVPDRITCYRCEGSAVSTDDGENTIPCPTCNATGEIEDDPSIDEVSSDAAEIGDEAEPAIARMYMRRSGRTVYKVEQAIIHPKFPWLAATPDYAAQDGGPDVEIKMVGEHATDGWGDDDDAIPDDYRAQVEIQMACRGTRETHVAAWLGGTRYRTYRIVRNEALANDLIDVARDFRERHIIPRIPPPIDGTASALAFLKRRYPEETMGMLDAPPEAAGYVTELRGVKSIIKVNEERKEQLETVLKGMIGPYAGISGDWGRTTWKTTAGAGTDYKGLIDVAPSRIVEALAQLPNIEQVRGFEDVIAQTIESLLLQFKRPGYRRFHVGDPPKPKTSRKPK